MSYVAPTAVQVQEAWNLVHPHGSGCYTGIDVDRHATRRGWEIRCACGRDGFVYEWNDGLTVEKHLPNGQVGGVFVPRDPPASFFLRERRKAHETTKTTFDDVATATRSLVFGGDVTQRANRDAMAAMSNVMRCVDQALRYRAMLGDAFQEQMNTGDYAACMLNGQRLWGLPIPYDDAASGYWIDYVPKGHAAFRLAQEEHARRVREGVKALPKPGPVVMCQGDWED